MSSARHPQRAAHARPVRRPSTDHRTSCRLGPHNQVVRSRVRLAHRPFRGHTPSCWALAHWPIIAVWRTSRLRRNSAGLRCRGERDVVAKLADASQEIVQGVRFVEAVEVVAARCRPRVPPRAGVHRARPPRAESSGTRPPVSAASTNAATRGHRRAAARAPSAASLIATIERLREWSAY